MNAFAEEALRRFPEIKPSMRDGDAELPYVVARHLVDWLAVIASDSLSGEVVKRVVAFDAWCMAQPRGGSAQDDIMTIALGGFREDLFRHDVLLPLIPRIWTRQAFVRNGGYLRQWVGEERYELALRQFGREVTHTTRKGGRRGGRKGRD